MSEITIISDNLIYNTAKILNSRFLKTGVTIEEEYVFEGLGKKGIYFGKEASENIIQLTELLEKGYKLTHNISLNERIIVFDILIKNIIKTIKTFQEII